MTRAINPTGSMLLDRSTAHPGSIDKSVFEKKTGSAAGSAVGQGSVNPNYLKECREDNPEPTPADEQTKSVALGNCKITTPPEDLVVDQPFEMSVETKSSNGAPSGQVTFRLFCTIPDPAGGPPKCEDQSLSFSGKVVDGLAKASGKLISPKKSVPAGTKLQYHVVAEHPDAKEKCESPKVEVESGKPPKPLAVWSLGAVHFGFDSSFILPSAAAKIADFKAEIAKHPGAAVAVFGHSDPVGEDDNNKGLSGRRAFAVWCLLAKDPTGWTQLANSDKWDLRTTQTMLAHLKNKTSGQPYYTDDIDGKTGPNTESAIASFRKDHTLGNGSNLDGKAKEGLFKAYMESVCEVTCKPEDFVGDPKDAKHQWACVGCSEFNPVLVFGKSDDARFRNASDKTERNAKNAPNRRATVFLFPAGAKGPGNVEFPCPQWSEGVAACRKQFFEDADNRRNPSDAERTWEKDKDTFACKFYAGFGEANQEPDISSKICLRLFGLDDVPLQNGAKCEVTIGESTHVLESDSEGYVWFPSSAPHSTFSVRWQASLDSDGDQTWLHRQDLAAIQTNDREIHERLLNLGFVDSSTSERVRSYQFQMGRMETGIESDIADEIIEWHDSGNRPQGETVTPRSYGLLPSNSPPILTRDPIAGRSRGPATTARFAFTSSNPILYFSTLWTPDEKSRLLAALQQLTNDRLTANNTEIRADGNGIGNMGTRLLRSLQHPSKLVTLSPLQGRDIPYASQTTNGAEVFVDFSKWHAFVVVFGVSVMSDLEVIPFPIVLAHELIHARHIVWNESRGMDHREHRFFIEPQQEYRQESLDEELYTVGIVRGSMFTENGIRMEQGYRPRTTCASPTRALDQQGVQPCFFPPPDWWPDYPIPPAMR